jgi:serine/threonine protein kinase
VIGKGSYGKVVLVKKIDSGEIFAMKILKKKYIGFNYKKIFRKKKIRRPCLN